VFVPGLGWASAMKRILLEALLVAVIGGLLAFGGNALSPKGISLTQDFFPANKHASVPPPLPTNNTATNASATALVPATNASSSSEADEVVAKLKAEGLGAINGDQAVELFNDPRRLQNLVAFIDARHDEEYQAGHIPGAYQFDYYYYAKFLEKVVPAVQGAEQVIVYCAGGKCEDSLNAALLLIQFVPKTKLMVYTSGITDWNARGRDVESGERNSGALRKGK
jgi:rhodanese-related sulfurtransferase